jgi:hypothetical protein
MWRGSAALANRVRTRHPAFAIAAGLGALLAGSSLLPAQAATAAARIVAAPAAARPAAGPGGTWGKAIEVPGTQRLNTAKQGGLNAISCPRPGDCSATGDYATTPVDYSGFVVGERGGIWGKATSIPGLGSLDLGHQADAATISCAAPGDCSAGGQYTDSRGDYQAFVATESGGVWRKAIEVPGTASLNVSGAADLESVSCAKPGDCSAGGQYGVPGDQGDSEAFVVTETNGVWGTAIEVPGSARLNGGRQAGVSSVSCAAPGDCSAGGQYTDKHGNGQAFVVTEAHGVWGNAIEVPGSAELNRGGRAEIVSVSCAMPGYCDAGGYTTPATGPGDAIVVTQSNGSWGKAVVLSGKGASTDAVSCSRPGYCGAGGSITGSRGKTQAFVATQWRGRWQRAIEVPGTASLNAGGVAEILVMSCTAPGRCSAGGYYTGKGGRPFNTQAFVVSENDRWGTAIEVPGTARLNTGADAAVDAISCASPEHCGAGGDYAPGTRPDLYSEPFVVTQK